MNPYNTYIFRTEAMPINEAIEWKNNFRSSVKNFSEFKLRLRPRHPREVFNGKLSKTELKKISLYTKPFYNLYELPVKCCDMAAVYVYIK